MRVALRGVENISLRVIKSVGVLVITEDHILIPMLDFDTPVRTVENHYPVGKRVFNAGIQPASYFRC